MDGWKQSTVASGFGDEGVQSTVASEYGDEGLQSTVASGFGDDDCKCCNELVW